MIHFIRNIQAYCHLEVIECAWKDLMEFLRKREGDLDALIQAHHTFLDRLVKKVFLISSKPGKEVHLDILPLKQCPHQSPRKTP